MMAMRALEEQQQQQEEDHVRRPWTVTTQRCGCGRSTHAPPCARETLPRPTTAHSNLCHTDHFSLDTIAGSQNHRHWGQNNTGSQNSQLLPMVNNATKQCLVDHTV